MEPGGHAELVALRTQVQNARLAEEARHTALWCLDQLPRLYADFFRTYESRLADAILRLARAVLKRLAEEGSGEDAVGLTEVLVSQLGGLHQRLGLAPLVLRPMSDRGPVKKRGPKGPTAAGRAVSPTRPGGAVGSSGARTRSAGSRR